MGKTRALEIMTRLLLESDEVPRGMVSVMEDWFTTGPKRSKKGIPMVILMVFDFLFDGF